MYSIQNQQWEFLRSSFQWLARFSILSSGHPANPCRLPRSIFARPRMAASECTWKPVQTGHGKLSRNIQDYTTWWFIPLSKWVITTVLSGLTPLIPFITRVVTILYSQYSLPYEFFAGFYFSVFSPWIGLRDNWTRKSPNLMGKSVVSCRFSREPIHWLKDYQEIWLLNQK